MAFDSDCFSHAIASTRRYLPDCTRLAATTRGRSADRAGGVHADQRLAGGADGVGHEQLGHHHALEEVGRLADHHGVDVVERRTRVGQRLVDGLAHQAVHRHVLPLGDVLRLPGAEHRGQLPRHVVCFPSRTATRFCCSAGPLVACASTRCAEPLKMCCAAKPMRSSPAENIGLAASVPPDGFTFVDDGKPDGLGEDQVLVGERRVDLGHLDRADVAARGRLGRRRGRR